MLTHKSKLLKELQAHRSKAALASKTYKKLRDKYKSPEDFDDWNRMLLRFSPYAFPGYLTAVKEATGSSEGIASLIATSVGAFTADALDAPAVYVSRELTSAIIRTEPTVTTKPELVLPCFFVCLPKGAFYTVEGSGVTSLFAYTPGAVEQALLSGGHSIEKAGPFVHKFLKDKDSICVVAVTDKQEVFTSITGWNYEQADYDGTVRWSTCTVLENIVKNVLLIYNYQRALISTCKSATKGSGFKTKKSDATRTPLPTTLLGQDFFTRCTTTYAQSFNNKSKAVRRPHWRKGHWHTVLTGAGRKERRLRWFQPVYVNPTLDT